jgi:hypothetical protein
MIGIGRHRKRSAPPGSGNNRSPDFSEDYPHPHPLTLYSGLTDDTIISNTAPGNAQGQSARR